MSVCNQELELHSNEKRTFITDLSRVTFGRFQESTARINALPYPNNRGGQQTKTQHQNAHFLPSAASFILRVKNSSLANSSLRKAPSNNLARSNEPNFRQKSQRHPSIWKCRVFVNACNERRTRKDTSIERTLLQKTARELSRYYCYWAQCRNLFRFKGYVTHTIVDRYWW